MLPIDAKPVPHLHATPSEVAASWPTTEPIIALIGQGGHSTWSRWSIIAPADGERVTLYGMDALEKFDEVLKGKSNATLLPNWIGYLGYELGYVIEPKSGTLPERGWPLIDLIWCERALVHDSETDEWWSIGGCQPPELQVAAETRPVEMELQEKTSEQDFLSAVQKTVEYIHAGDIFQANITRRFSASVQGNIRSTALAMLQEPGGWFGAWLEFPEDGRYVMSMSPELFLQFDVETREIVTRPMKGTRPEQDEPEQLLRSPKDAAELHMIVDLMRNDLGRICEFGSIKVRHGRSIERHPTVWQCVGEVNGRVREDVTLTEVLRNTFPAGSITGAPKIRAMQIIQELESTQRGPYCGAIGVIGKSLMLSVAIRTALFEGQGTPDAFEGTMEYSTGCGIVAESEPEAERLESEVKTRILQQPAI
jgi:anthranilate/para-aminobenzoate synthase component I